jgi:hypothetical protein
MLLNKELKIRIHGDKFIITKLKMLSAIELCQRKTILSFLKLKSQFLINGFELSAMSTVIDEVVNHNFWVFFNESVMTVDVEHYDVIFFRESPVGVGY